MKNQKIKSSIIQRITKLNFLFIGLVLTLFFITISLMIIEDTDERMRNELLEKANIISSSISFNELTKLQGNENDLESFEYLHLKEQLYNIRTSSESYKFLYVIGKKEDGSVFFFMDSQSPNSSDYVPPGELYTEVSDEYLEVFTTQQKTTVGPVTDRWGTMITALVPIINNETNELIAVLGLDILDNNWQTTIYSHSLPLIGFMLILILASVVIIILDKRSNKKLQKSEENFRSVFAVLPNIAVQGYDQDRNVTFWNTASEKLYGYTKKEVHNKKLEDLIIPTEMREGVISVVHDWYENNISIPSSELTLIGKDKLPVTVYSSHVMIEKINGKKEMFCLDIDISNLKHSEKKLKQSEEKYRLLTESLEDVVTTISPLGKLLYSSPAVTKFGGYIAEEEVGNHVSKYFARKTELVGALKLMAKF